jgi:sec-independent protein translocase protein TatA
MGFLGGQEILVILIIVILLFGAKKIPELAKGLGTGIKEFKKASSEVEKQIDTKDDATKNDSTKNKEGKSS